MSEADRFFSSRSGKGVRVAVVDSGVHAEHPHVAGVAGGIAVVEDGSGPEDYADRIGHGTAVAAAIREKAPGADLFAVKIFTDSLSARLQTLIQAIDWAVQNRVQLVNLSLGTARQEHEGPLRAAVGRARSNQVVIVAACEAAGVRWLPGSLEGVLPVYLDWDCPRREYRVTTGAAGRTMFGASGYPRTIPGVPRDRNLRGISFAVANMTGFAARALEAHPGASLEKLVDLLSLHGAALSRRH